VRRHLLDRPGIDAVRWPSPGTIEVDGGGETIVVDISHGKAHPLRARERDRRHRAAPRTLRPGFLANTAPVREVPAPDGGRLATERDNDLWLRDAVTDQFERLTFDGAPDSRWEVELASWSPDGATLAVIRADTRGVSQMPVVHWLEATERVESFPYVRTGGPYERTELHLVRLSDRSLVRAALPGDELFWLSVAGWLVSGEALVLVADRFDKVLSLLAVDPTSGDSRLVVEERQDTFVYGIRLDHIRDSVFHLPGEAGLAWLSERDGWRHAYRYAADGTLLNRLTEGPFEVERVVGTDHSERVIFLLAHSDLARPYDVHLCSVGVEGQGFRQLSQDPGVHRAVVSPAGEAVLDSHSSLHRAPRTDLYRADGTLVATVSDADLGTVDGTSLGSVEEFVAPAADGQTPLHGTIWHPPGFDRHLHYPVVELIYAGPQHVTHPRDYRQADAVLALALAQLGLVVFCVDGRGTPGVPGRRLWAVWTARDSRPPRGPGAPAGNACIPGPRTRRNHRWVVGRLHGAAGDGHRPRDISRRRMHLWCR
jgi:dipeptidyl aminopeptidase/acylaminoacyl peptidase